MLVKVTTTGVIAGIPDSGLILSIWLVVTSGAGLVTLTDGNTLDFDLRCSGVDGNSAVFNTGVPYSGDLTVGALTGTGAEAWIEIGAGTGY